MTDRNYKLAKTLIDTINNAEYTNNEPVQYSPINMPEIFISAWEDVKALDKAEINTAALAAGFELVS